MTSALFDWPRAVRPSSAILVAAGAVQDGYVSRGGYENDVRIPGARVRLEMNFYSPSHCGVEWYSWLCSKLKGNLFRVPVWQSPQVARDGDLGIASRSYANGIPFSSGAFFSSGKGFAYEPTIETSAAALEGEATVTLDETRWPGLVRYGKFIGIGRGLYHVEDVSGEGATVTATISPPLRRDVDSGEFVSLRPSLICKARDLSSFIAMFQYGRWVQPGSLTMYEVIDERFL